MCGCHFIRDESHIIYVERSKRNCSMCIYIRALTHRYAIVQPTGHMFLYDLFCFIMKLFTIPCLRVILTVYITQLFIVNYIICYGEGSDEIFIPYTSDLLLKFICVILNKMCFNI